MGRTNDAIIYGGRVQLFVSGDEKEAKALADALPSLKSKDYGRPFAEIFSAVKGERQQLYLRPIDRLEATAIEDTEGAANPFFSPDGKWIAFWADGALRKVAVSGGPATTICSAERIVGGDWGDDGSIVFAGFVSTIFQVPASGGTARAVTSLDERKGEFSHRLPCLLPGARAVMFTAITHYLPDWDEAEIVVQQLASGVR
jgi:serine/threonine-protein kinase